ncbi:MAG: hypothetical protein K2Z81_28165, partial [Cyanobacteria bacterium]|nr:hypothetical protein [Cyanobacteriota bacterium]
GIQYLENVPLAHLGINNTRVSDACVKSLLKIPGLKEVAISETKLTDAGIAQLIAKMKLTSLTIGGPQVTDETMKVVSTSNSLEDVTLLRATVTANGIRSLRPMPRLTSIQFRSTPVNSDVLAALQSFPHLEELELDKTSLTEADMKLISRLKITRLIFHATSVPKNFLSYVYTMRRLQTLKLDGAISDAHLIGIERLSNLREFALSSNRIRGVGLLALEKLKKIQTMDVSLCPGLQPYIVADLRKKMPECAIKAPDLEEDDEPVEQTLLGVTEAVFGKKGKQSAKNRY